MYHRLRTCFGHTQWYFMVMRLKWKLNSVCLEIVLILAQDRCAVCGEHTIDSKSFCTHLMELLGDVGHVESPFRPFGDSVSVGARLVTVCTERTIGSGVVLDAPNVTSR